MNILFVNHLKPWTASFLRHLGLAKELARRGHRVSFIARRPSEERRQDNTLQEYFPDPQIITYWIEPFEQSLLFNILRLLGSVRRFDLIHVNKANPFTSTTLLLPKVLGGKRLVLDWEDWDGVGGYIAMARKSLPARFALGFFEEVVPESCDSIIVVSKILGWRAEKKGIPRDKIFYVPNGFDESLFNEGVSGVKVRRALGLGNRPVILFMSALHLYEKENWSRILQSLRYVVDEVPNATLLIVGRGDVNAVMRYAEELNLGGNVVYAGYIPHTDVPTVIASADVAVNVVNDNIYYRSQSPMVIPEYMAMGKAIVSSDVGELHTMLENEAGLLVRDQHPEAFGEAILRLLLDPDLRERLGRNASAKARAEYSYRVLAKRVEQAYIRALEA